MRGRVSRKIVLLGCVFAGGYGGPVLAQQQTAANASPATGGVQLQEIVVTAQKRSESLQKVPVTVTAVNSAALTTAGVKSTMDLAVAVPGINVVRQNTAVQFFIRGVGTTGGSAGQESATATFVDGVYMPSQTGSTFSLNNIERVEVLKGPQGTLYGRNATAGAVNVITRTPSTTTAVMADFGYGNYQTVESNFYGTTGITDNIAIDLAAHYSDRNEGFGHNVTTGQEVNRERDQAFRSKLYADYVTTRVTLAGDYSKESGDFATPYHALPGASLLSGQQGWPYGFYDTESDAAIPTRIVNKGASAKIEQDIGSLTLSSISAYRYLRESQVVDYDTTPLPLLRVPQNEINGQFTEELQLASNKNSKFTWILGLFYLDSYAKYDPFQVDGLGVANGQAAQVIRDRQDTTSLAAYGQGTYRIGDSTHITVGLRYTYDRRKLTGNDDLVFNTGAVVPIADGIRDKTSFKKPQWRFAVDRQITPNELVYASYSRGVKSGVYNLTGPTQAAVKPETLDAFEVGSKSTLFDRRVHFNIAAFYYNYKNIQISKLVDASLTLLNAATARIYGIDADFEAAVTRSLTIHGGIQALHDRYVNFKGVPVLIPGAAGNVQQPCPPDGGGICDGSGNRMIKAPDFLGNIGADYRFPLAGGTTTLSAVYSYNSGFYWEPDNRTKQNALGLLNGSLQWETADKHFHVRLWANNITNKKYFATVSEAVTGDIGVPAPPRTYGFSTGFKF